MIAAGPDRGTSLHCALIIALALMAGSAMATTVTTSSVSVPIGLASVNVVYPAQSGLLEGGGSSTYAAEIGLQTNIGVLNSYCADLFDSISTGSNAYSFTQNALTAGASYVNGSLHSSFTTAQVSLITNLLTNGSLQNQNTINTAALQVAIWDVEYATAAVNGTYSISGSSSFYYTADPGDSNSAAVLATAQTFLNDATGYQKGGVWVAATWHTNATQFVEYLTSTTGTVQNQLYLATATPEPSAITILGFGLISLSAVRRRKPLRLRRRAKKGQARQL